MMEFLIGITVICFVTRILLRKANNRVLTAIFGLFFGAIDGVSKPDYAKCKWELHDEISPDCPKEVYSQKDIEYWFGIKEMTQGTIQVHEYCKSCRRIQKQWKEKDVFSLVGLPFYE